jgi:hypothetical protein
MVYLKKRTFASDQQSLGTTAARSGDVYLYEESFTKAMGVSAKIMTLVQGSKPDTSTEQHAKMVVASNQQWGPLSGIKRLHIGVEVQPVI